MADDEIRLRAIIEAEDKSAQVFNDAKKRVEDLAKIQLQMNSALDASMTKLANGQQKSNLSAKTFYDITKQLDEATKGLVGATKDLTKAQNDLDRAHEKSSKAQEKYARDHKTVWEKATADIKGYAGSFVGVAAAVEVVRRSINEFAQFERGMARIEMQTGATSKQMSNLGHSVDALARETGQSVSELQKSFMTFSAEMGSGGDDVIKMFKEVQQAAHAAGTSFDTMSRTAVQAVKTMNVPMNEVKGMLDIIVKDIPASSMQAWDNVAPRILGIMRSLGATGKDSAQQAATAFGHLTTALGSAAAAGSVQEQMLRKATDQSSIFGRVMTPQLIGLQNQMGGVTKSGEAMYQQMKLMGMYDEDPQKALMMQQKFSFTDEMVRGGESYHQTFMKVTEEVAKTGEAFDVVEKRILRLNRGPMAAVDDLKGAFAELWTTIGSVFGGVIPQGLANMVTGLKNDLERIQAIFKWIRQNITHTEDAQGNPIKAKEGDPGPSGNFFGANVFPNFLTGQHGGAPTTVLGTKVPGGPWGPGKIGGSGGVLGFATGGAFEVEGQGGRDTTPVGFMATRGERVDITTPTQESLQQQEDKADIAMREHFARFHANAFTKTTAASWWPSGGVRGPGGGGSVAGGGGPGGAGIPGGSQGGGGATTAAPGSAGADGKVSPAAATSTAPAGTTPATLPGSVASLGYEPGKFTPVQDLTTASGTSGAAGGGGGLAADRAKFAAELAANPALREKVLAIANNEQGGNAQGMQATIESMMNRASYQGTTLEKQARWVSEHGYYADGKKASGMNRPITEAALTGALGGSNVSNYGTDNASTKWGADRIKRDLYRQTNYINGEYFSSPGQNPAGPGMGNFNKYQAWLERMKKGDAAAPAASANKDSAVKTATLTPNANADLSPGMFDPNLTKTATGGTAAGEPNALYAGDVQGTGRGSGGRFNAPAGSGMTGEKETVTLSNGQKVTVNKAAATQFKGFFNDLISAGAPVKNLGGYGLRGGNPSQHPPGMAVDWAQHSRNVVDKDVQKWLNENKEKLAVLEKRWGMSGGQNWKNPDTGHWSIDTLYGAAHAAAAEAASKGTGVAAAANIKTATVKPNTGTIDSALLGPTIHNKPAAAPTNTKVATDAPAAGQKTDDGGPMAAGKNLGGGGPKAAGKNLGGGGGDSQGGAKAAGKNLGGGTKVAAATVPHPVSPQADPIPAGRQWGGDVRGGRSYTVGESGPETFTPAGPGSISPGVGGMGSLMGEYQKFAEMMRAPIVPNLQMPRAGPIRQRMSRHVESQRERDVGRMTRHAAHSDIGFA